MKDQASAALPPEFSDLEAYVAGWGQPGTDARHHHRQTAALADIRAFYNAMQPRLDAVFAYIDRFGLNALPAPAEALLNLSFGYIEAAIAVEIFDAPGVPGASYPHGFSVIKELHTRQQS